METVALIVLSTGIFIFIVGIPAASRKTARCGRPSDGSNGGGSWDDDNGDGSDGGGD